MSTGGRDVVVVGGGMAGLLAALFLARDGHDVTVLERDDTDLPATADEAFEHWDRRGASHARQSHALLARLRGILRERAPDVLAELMAQGATELSVERILPPDITDRRPRDGDEDLAILCCRRLTIEWVLRRAVTAEPTVTWRGGVVVEGLVADGTDVRGVRLTGGEVVEADLVVVSGGRHSPVLAWIAELGGGVAPTEEETDAGIVYLSRFYRLADGRELPVLNKDGAGGDLGYVAFAGFYGDNHTFSITFGVPTNDRELLAALRPEAAWEAAIRTLVPLEPWTAPGLATPITGVEAMAGLRNRLRRFVVDGVPVATGLVVIGDAAVATNPWYGKGCSTAGIAADALARSLAETDDPVALALAMDDVVSRELVPHVDLSCRQDADRIKLHTARHDGTEPDPTAAATRDFVLNGLIPATRVDPDVFRAFFRSFNMLDAPEALLANTAVMAAAGHAHATKGERPPLPTLGPDRDELLAVMAAAVS